MELNKIYQMDCMKGMRDIEDNSVDLILTDPPYNISRNRKFSRDKSKDVNLNFGDWDILEDDDYYKWLLEIWDECNRVLKDLGQLIIFSPRNWEFEAVLDQVFEIKRAIVWHKTNPTPQFMKVSYLSSYEKIIWAVKDNSHPSKFTFNFSKQKDMHDMIQSSICMGTERVEHPTQKPMTIVEKLLKIHSNKGDLVLDPFAGSGTTPIACLLNGRKFLAYEKEDEYLKLIKQRLGVRSLDIVEERDKVEHSS